MAVDHTKTRRANWDLTWNATDLGGVDKVTPDLKLMLDPVKIGTAGKLKLDDRFVGLEDGASVKVEVREVTITRIKALCPWFGTVSGYGTDAGNVVPPLNTLMATTYAQKLTLDPTDVPSGTKAQNLVLWKTVPTTGYQLPRDGVTDDKWEVTFMVYPDASKLPANPYGIIGDDTPT